MGAMTRTISFGNFLQVNGEFMADSTTTPARVIEGTFNIQQNGLLDAFSGQDAKLSVYVRSGGAQWEGAEGPARVWSGLYCCCRRDCCGSLLGDRTALLNQRILHQGNYHRLQPGRVQQQDDADGGHQLADDRGQYRGYRVLQGTSPVALSSRICRILRPYNRNRNLKKYLFVSNLLIL